jgi:hypothetical protein
MATLISSCANHTVASGDRRAALAQLKSVPKFQRDDTNMYPGAATEKDRLRLEHAINELIDNLLANDVASLDKPTVLKQFKTTLNKLELDDSEDQERVCYYLENIMDIFQIESSDGLLNNWRHGFDPS